MAAAPALNDLLQFHIEILKGPHAGERFEFQKAQIRMGRDSDNDIVLSKDPRISRHHLEIKQREGHFHVVNVSQKNYVLQNGQNVTNEKIENFAVIQLGDTEFRFLIQGNTQAMEPLVTKMPAHLGIAPAAKAAPLPGESAAAVKPLAVPGAFPPPRKSPGGPSPRAQFRTASRGSSPSAIDKLVSNPKFSLFAVVGFIAIVMLFSSLGDKTKKAENRAFRTEEELTVVREEAENELKAFEEHKARMNQQIYQKAYENFLRGYRDYRQGQFLRARESFQVVLNLDPENELARRYLNLAKIRFDELVKFHMLQGRRYLEKQNYRMCKASFQTVMTMLGNDPSNPEYKEALMTHRQCAAAMERRF